MQTNIKQITPAEYELEITASAEDLAPEIDEALRAQRTRTTLKGFRPGKVPMSLVRKMYGRAIAYEVAERAIERTFEEEVRKNEEYDVLGQPKLTVLDFEDIDGEMKAVVKFGVRPEFELKDFSGEKVTRLVHQVTDEDVDKEIEGYLSRGAEMVPLEGEATEESHATIDLQRLDDATGTPIIGDREEGVSFFLNDPKLKEELRTALIGKREGDTFRVEITHEHDHHHDHDHPHDEAESELLHVPGQEKEKHTHTHTHSYEVTVKGLQKRVLPELTDDFIKEATGERAQDEASFRELIESLVKDSWTDQSKRYLNDRIVERLLEIHEFDVPESLVDLYLDSFVSDVRERNEGKLPPGFNEDRFRASNLEEARRQAKWALIRDRIIDDASLTVTEEDREAHFERAAKNSEVSKEDFKRFYQSVPNLAEQLEQQLMSEKVFKYLEGQFQIEDKDRDAAMEELNQKAGSQ